MALFFYFSPLALQAGQLSKERFLFFTQVMGQFHLDLDEEIAIGVLLVKRWHPLAFKPKRATVLSFGWDFEGKGTLKRGHGYLSTQNRRVEVYRYVTMEVIPQPLEDFVRYDADFQIEIAAGATRAPRPSLAAHAHARTGPDTRGDLHLQSPAVKLENARGAGIGFF